MSGVEIRGYRPGDEAKIVELLDEAFGGWVKADLECSKLEHWRWKYLDYPSKSSIITVATVGGEIIGVNSQKIVPLQMGDKVTWGSYSGDLAVKKEYRGHGVSNDLNTVAKERMRREGVEYFYFVTQNPILVKSYNKRYHVFPVPILNLARIQDVGLQLRKMPMKNASLIKAGYLTLRAVNKYKRQNKLKNPRGFKVKQVTRFPNGITRVIENNSSYRFLVNNGAEYLNWRYCDTQAGRHDIWVAWENDAPTGYIVSRINRYREDYPVAYVMDLMTDPYRTDVAGLLLGSALNCLDSQDINIVTCMVPKGHPYEDVFHRHGFIDSRNNLHLYTNLNEVGQEHLLQDVRPDMVHFCYGCIDSLPVSIPKA